MLFLQRNHYHDKCTVVTDLSMRKKLVFDNKLCLKCLSPNHMRKNCQSRRNCYSCKSPYHHTAICEKVQLKGKPENQNIKITTEEPQNLHVNTMKSVILQTAGADVCDVEENRSRKIRILLDPGSQKTYISLKTVDALKLNPLCEEHLVIKTFGDVSEKPMKVKEYQFVVKSIDGTNLYLKGYGVPKICSTLTGQEVDVAIENYPFLKGEIICNKINENIQEIEVLIGSDYYWTVIGNEIKRCGEEGLVAIKSRLGWIFTGPVSNQYSTNVLSTHVMTVGMEVDEKNLMNEIIEIEFEIEFRSK